MTARSMPLGRTVLHLIVYRRASHRLVDERRQNRTRVGGFRLELLAARSARGRLHTVGLQLFLPFVAFALPRIFPLAFYFLTLAFFHLMTFPPRLAGITIIVMGSVAAILAHRRAVRLVQIIVFFLNSVPGSGGGSGSGAGNTNGLKANSPQLPN